VSWFEGDLGRGVTSPMRRFNVLVLLGGFLFTYFGEMTVHLCFGMGWVGLGWESLLLQEP
jgi:hypothetical protein